MTRKVALDPGAPKVFAVSKDELVKALADLLCEREGIERESVGLVAFEHLPGPVVLFGSHQ